MKKIAFVIPYFGKFNNYFSIFLKSCSWNPEVDFLIFTDDKTPYDYPPNVIVKYCTFQDIQERIKKLFDFPVEIERPYKLCDYRPAYGVIFQQELKGYLAWGECDCDLIWGNISSFIKSTDFLKYGKIGVFGHCTIYRNDSRINKAFMQPWNGCLLYKKYYQSPKNHSFDEEFNGSINNIFESLNYPIKYDIGVANVYTKSSDFQLTRLAADKHHYIVDKKKKAFFVWEEGHLIRYTLGFDRNIKKEEFLYLHLQSRPMKVRFEGLQSPNRFKIIPNSFDLLETYPVNKENFYLFKRKYFNLHYFRLRSKNLYVKIRRRFHLGELR